MSEKKKDEEKTISKTEVGEQLWERNKEHDGHAMEDNV